MAYDDLGADAAHRNDNVFAPAYLVVMPKSWDEVLSLLAEVQQAWDDLDLEDEAESARVGNMHHRAMLALTQFPAPNAAALEFKIRTLHEADRIQCDDFTLARICSEIALF
jgi:hypothetical protein